MAFERRVTGKLLHVLTPGTTRVVEGRAAPSWWVDDEEAMASNMSALASMRRTPRRRRAPRR